MASYTYISAYMVNTTTNLVKSMATQIDLQPFWPIRQTLGLSILLRTFLTILINGYWKKIDKWRTKGFLDECSNYNILGVDLEEAQKPLKPSIRPPAVEDWEIMRKYFCYVPAKVVRNTYKCSTQHGVLPPSSHLQKRFKLPNPLLNLHRRNEADATDQIFSDTPAMNGDKTSAHIFVGHNSKIVDVYKAKDHSAKEFLGAF